MSSASPGAFSGGPVFHPVEQRQANPTSLSTSQVVVAVTVLLSGALLSSLNALIPPHSSSDIAIPMCLFQAKASVLTSNSDVYGLRTWSSDPRKTGWVEVTFLQ